MAKAIIVEFNFMTRIVIDDEKENLYDIMQECRPKIMEKVKNELAENLSEWYDDEECPYDPDFD